MTSLNSKCIKSTVSLPRSLNKDAFISKETLNSRIVSFLQLPTRSFYMLYLVKLVKSWFNHYKATAF